MYGAFGNCYNLKLNASDKPDLSEIDSMSYMFYNVPKVTPKVIENWDIPSSVDKWRMFEWEAERSASPDRPLVMDNSLEIKLNSTQTGMFASEFDDNVFKINVVESGRIDLNITDGKSMVASQIFDKNGSLLARSYDEYGRESNEISLNVVPNIYYIRVLPYEESYEAKLKYGFSIAFTPASEL